MKSIDVLSNFVADNSIKGFLALDEAKRLMELVSQISIAKLGPVLEIGSYCGKSSIFLGEACKAYQNILFCVDHHRGSEEHQLGEEYHDTDLFDKNLSVVDSLPAFRRTLFLANLEDVAIPIVASSKIVAKHWSQPLAMVFVDGGHSEESAMHDCFEWSKHIAPGGILAVHDLYEFPEQGGQAPFNAFNALYNQGGWRKLKQINSLGALMKL